MISWKYIQPLLSDAVKHNLKLNVTARKIHELHPSDLADILEELDRVNRSSVFRTLDLQTAAQTLEEVEDPTLQVSLIESAPAERASDILEEMAPDEATDLLADLPKEKKDRFIRTMEKPSREAIEELLKFREGTAGSIMTKDFLSFHKDRTIGDGRRRVPANDLSPGKRRLYLCHGQRGSSDRRLDPPPSHHLRTGRAPQEIDEHPSG